MKRLYFLLLFAFTQSSNSFGQNKIKASKPKIATTQLEKLIGTWRLIEFADLDSTTSKWTYPYGKNPRGYFTYTKSNIVNLNISSEVPLKISEDSAKKYLINLYDYVWN